MHYLAEARTCITEEILPILIKNIFAEEFQKQEKNIINIISGNFEITMKEINDLKAEVSDLKDSLEFTENVIEKKVEKLETELDNLKDKVQDIWDYQIDPDYIQHKLIELEDRSRRNNIKNRWHRRGARENVGDIRGKSDQGFQREVEN